MTHACADVHNKKGNFTTLQKGNFTAFFVLHWLWLQLVQWMLDDGQEVDARKHLYACPGGNVQNFLNLS